MELVTVYATRVVTIVGIPGFCVLCVCVQLLVSGDSAIASIWHVEKDDSGDFTVLQEAVDAAASGDTIRVGAGRYDDWRPYGIFDSPCALIVDSKDLVVIGGSDGTAVIGALAPWVQGEPWYQGVALVSDSRVVIRNLRFENLYGGVMSWMGGEIEVRDCCFWENEKSIVVDNGGRAYVGGSEFLSNESRSGHIALFDVDAFVAERCEFRIPKSGFQLNVSGSMATIRDCRFDGGWAALNVDRGSHAEVTGCSVVGSDKGIVAGIGAPVVVARDCSISDVDIAIMCYQEGYRLEIEAVYFGDVDTATLVADNLDEGFVINCILAKGSHGVVTYYPDLYAKSDAPRDELCTFDMRNNSWGTTDAASIQAWIMDNTDNPEIDYRILWRPFVDTLVPAREESLGSFKAMFR